MTVYIVLILLVLFCIVMKYDRHHDTKNTKIVYYSICVLLSLIAGIRYHVGSDTANYIDLFEQVPTLGSFFDYLDIRSLSQPLWVLYLSICKSVCSDFIIVQLTHAFAVNMLLGRLIFRFCERPFVGMLFYICCIWWNFNFEIMREALCVAIYLTVFLNYSQDKNIVKFCINSLPIVFIHYFAFIPILLTLISHFLNYRQVLIAGLSISIVLFFILDNSFINQLLLVFDGTISNDLSDRVSLYADGEDYGFKSMSILGGVVIIITSVLYPILISRSEQSNPLIAKILLFYAFMIILRMKLLIVVRFCNYWELLLIIYAINSICRHKKTLIKAYIVGCLAISLLTGLKTFLSPQPNDTGRFDCRYVPYHSYITKSVDSQRESLYY